MSQHLLKYNPRKCFSTSYYWLITTTTTTTTKEYHHQIIKDDINNAASAANVRKLLSMLSQAAQSSQKQNKYTGTTMWKPMYTGRSVKNIKCTQLSSGTDTSQKRCKKRMIPPLSMTMSCLFTQIDKFLQTALISGA